MNVGIGLSKPKVVDGASTDNQANSEVFLLTQRLARGDEEAFREFHRLYFDRLYRFLLVVTGGQEQQAEEALQETLIRLLRYARPFDDGEIFWRWLRAVAKNAAHDLGRKNRRYLSLLQHFALHREKHLAKDDHLERRLSAVLQECFDELDGGDRRLLEGKYFDGRTVRELSMAAGLTEKAIESRLVRLRRILRQRIVDRLKQK